MRNRLLFIAGVISLGVAQGCAHTSMTSMASPDMPRQGFRNILVYAGFVDLGVRQATELTFVSSNTSESVRFVAAHQLFFPGRQYTSEEMAATLREKQIDASLLIAAGQQGTSSSYIPPTFTSSCTVWNSSTGCQQATTTTSGGQAVQKPWAQFTAQLFDAHTGKVVWFATANTGGNAFASSTTLATSMANETLSRLRADGVIR